jgi:hypothetical protein
MKPVSKGDAVGIESAIVAKQEFGANGAVVMMRHLGSVARKLNQDVPHVEETQLEFNIFYLKNYS